MNAPTRIDVAAVECALRADTELAEDLRSLLEGDHGRSARDLFVRCFAAQLRTRRSPGCAALPALADALQVAMGGPR